MFDNTTQKPMPKREYLILGENLFLGYPTAGEEPLRVIFATRTTQGRWRFHEVRELTTAERIRVRNSDYLYHFTRAHGTWVNSGEETTWSLVTVTKTTSEHSTMGHLVSPRRQGGHGVGV